MNWQVCGCRLCGGLPASPGPLEAAARPVLGGPPRLATLLDWLKSEGERYSESLCQFIHSGLGSCSRWSRLAFQRRRSKEGRRRKKTAGSKGEGRKTQEAIPVQNRVKVLESVKRQQTQRARLPGQGNTWKTARIYFYESSVKNAQ